MFPHRLRGGVQRWCGVNGRWHKSKHYGFTRGGGALERGHGAAHKRLAQLGDALHGVGAFALPIEAAELVRGQAAKGEGVSTGADTKAHNLEWRHT